MMMKFYFSLIQQTHPKGYMVKYVRFNTFNHIRIFKLKHKLMYFFFIKSNEVVTIVSSESLLYPASYS